MCGTGLLGEFTTAGTQLNRTGAAWRETRGPLSAFGHVLDEQNCPVPTVLPALDLTLTPQQLRQVGIRNGFALRDTDGEQLGGAEPFTARWTGTLLVERGGEYRFHAGRAPPGRDANRTSRRRSTTAGRSRCGRGDKTWVVLSHCHGEAQVPAARSAPLMLRRGAYEITAEFEQRGPLSAGPGDVCRSAPGSRSPTAGPDTAQAGVRDPAAPAVPRRSPGPHSAPASRSPAARRSSSTAGTRPDLRDIRRTYQRAFKALLFAERFGLSRRRVPGYRQSELGYLLGNPQAFEGTSYYRTGATSFATHHAWFDLDLLPVADPYPPPPPARTDARLPEPAAAGGAVRLVGAGLRLLLAARGRPSGARQRPAWLLFAEAARAAAGRPGANCCGTWASTCGTRRWC